MTSNHDEDSKIANMALRFGVQPRDYQNNERVRALLQFKIRLDHAIMEARRADGERLDYRIAQKKQADSKTKDSLLETVPQKFGLTQKDLDYGPVASLVSGVANALIYLALLTEPIMKTASRAAGTVRRSG